MIESNPRSVVMIDGVAHKKCPDCEQVKPVEEGFGLRSPDTNGRRFPVSFCKSCRRARRVSGSWVRKTEPRPDLPAGRAWCPKCEQDLPSEKFGVSNRSKTGLTRWCRECSARANREAMDAMTPEQRATFLKRRAASTARNPEGKKRRYLRHAFNMTLEDYERMYAGQDGLCAICKQPETAERNGRVLDLAVDHDHACCPTKGRSCGKCIRGLLCGNCNNGLGKFHDDLGRLESAVEYLRACQEATQAA